MAVDRSQFHIEINSTADLVAMDATIAKLKGQIEATKTLGKSTADLESQLEKANSSRIQAELDGFTAGAKGVGEGAKEAGKGVEEMIGGHHGIHAIGHALNEAMPGLMQFTRFLTSGFTAAIGGAVLAYSYLNDKIDEFSKQVDDLAGSDAATGGWAQKLAQNMRDSHVAAEVLTRDIERILDMQERLAEATDRLIARQKQQASVAQGIADAQKSLAEARLELAVKLGEITPEQSVRIKLEIDEEDFRRKEEAKIAGIKAELQARQQEQTSLGGQGGALDQDQQAAEQARAASDKAAAAKTKNDTLLENARENLKSAKEDQTKADEAIMGLKGWANKPQREFAERQSEAAQNKIAQYTKEINQYEGKEPVLNAAADDAKKDLDAAASQWQEDAKALHDLNQTIGALNASLASSQAESAAMISLHSQSNAVAAASARAPQTLAAQQVLLNRAASPDRGAAATALEASQFTTLSTAASDAMRNADINLRHGGVGAAGPSSVPQLIGLVQQLTQFLAAHPALQPQARGDMQSEIDEIKRDLADLSSRNAMNRGFQ